MSDSNWRRIYTVGLVAAAIAAFIFAAWLWSSADSQQIEIEQQAAKTTQAYSDPRYIAAESECPAVPEAERTNCIPQEREAASEAERNERDLEAQRIMAAWTRAIGIATIIGMAFGIFGLSLIFVTFRETRRAADAGFAANHIARTSSERQLRAYMAVAEAKLELFPDDDQIIIQITLQNCGQTPADNVRIMAESYAAPYPLEDERPFLPVQDEWYTTVGPGMDLGSVKRIFTNDVSAAVEAAKNRTGAFYIQGVCEYVDAFKIPRTTHFRYAFAGIVADTGLVMQPAATGNYAT